MTFAEAAAIMLGGGSSPVIQSITITENGHYEAPEGIDGYNPIDVNVPDRYDEGYKDGYDEGHKDGYKDAKDLNQKIIEQLNGDLPSVTDENGNTIENAIVSDNPDYTNDILKNIVFSNGGGSVTVQNLSGDAKLTLVVDRVYIDGVNCGVRYDVVVMNTLTGATYIQTGRSTSKLIDYSEINVVIDGFEFSDYMHRAEFQVHFHNTITGENYGYGSIGSIASIVNAEKFGTSDDQTAITQTQG